MFDIADCLDTLRSHSTAWLEARRREVVAEVRRLQSEEFAIVRVLDERGRIDLSTGLDGESARTVREKVETARALESLPAVAAAAHAGNLSAEQLGAVVKLADEVSDAEWAVRAPNVTPGDLARMAREKSKPTVEEGRAHAGRHLGAKFEATIDKMVDKMRPPKGQAWERWERRAADALVLMCDAVDAAERIEAPMAASRPLLVVDVPEEGPATVAGIPLADAMVEQLRASASVEPLLSTMPVCRSRRGSVRAVSRRRPSGPCSCATGTAAAGTVACTSPSDADPERAVRLGRQPEPSRWAPARARQRPHPEQAEQAGLPPPRAGPNAA